MEICEHASQPEVADFVIDDESDKAEVPEKSIVDPEISSNEDAGGDDNDMQQKFHRSMRALRRQEMLIYQVFINC